VSGIHIG
jgi:hypothetical protein